MTYYDNKYISEALELIKEQKGILKLKNAKALKPKENKKIK